MGDLSGHAASHVPGSWSFSVRTPFGRVVACVSNDVLCTCFGARDHDEIFSAFTTQIQLLHEATLVHLEHGFSHVVEIAEEDIALALRRMH